MGEINEQDQSEFNAGIATLMRIDKVKKALIDAQFLGDIKARYRLLASYYMELVSIVKDSDEEVFNPKFRKHQEYYNNYKDLKTKNKRIPMELIDWLDNYEMELRNLEQKYGLNIPKKFDPRYALAGRR